MSMFTVWEGRSGVRRRIRAAYWGRSSRYPHVAERPRTATSAGYSRDQTSLLNPTISRKLPEDCVDDQTGEIEPLVILWQDWRSAA
jgi:hypothetical protein